MNGNERISKWRSMWLSSAWLLVGVVVYLSLVRLDIDMPAEGGDKVGHVLAYATLSFWFMQVYVTSAARVRIAVMLVALGIVMEILQGFTGYRTYDYADMVANTIGVA